MLQVGRSLRRLRENMKPNQQGDGGYLELSEDGIWSSPCESVDIQPCRPEEW